MKRWISEGNKGKKSCPRSNLRNRLAVVLVPACFYKRGGLVAVSSEKFLIFASK